MKLLVVLSCSLSCFFFCCKKDGFISSPDAKLVTGVDTLRFDTVFTSVGSFTRSFTLVNGNSQKLRISNIKLGGGATSPFKINVDGLAGTSFSNIELNANDSMYVFVKVTIDPNVATNLFVILDSIQVDYNGNTSIVYLQAFGQNARFIKGQTITSNTVWNNSLPYVIQSNLEVTAGAILTIEKGTKVYCSATAAIIVNGSLKVMGEKNPADHVFFRGARLDADYKDLPGGWPGIILTANSRNNEMNFAEVLNAYQAIVVVGGANLAPAKLVINECIIHNAYDIGLYGLQTSITARNCLISQCGNDGEPGIGGSNVMLTGGGKYNFEHCTMATFSNLYQNHKQPVCFISNSDGGTVASLQATFTNCIIYGQGGSAEDELVIQKAASDPVSFFNSFYKIKNTDPAGVTFTGCFKNTDPLFDSINASRQEYNFRLKENSPAVDAGKTTALTQDLDGNPRLAGIKPDAGCYEKQ
ncbi:hypothetical protein BH10BAC3_BH10BAC3_06660 [soil metagenome]